MSNKRIDIVVDLETLGVENSAPILQMSLAHFDIESGKIYSVFNTAISPSGLDEKLVKVNIETLKWWTGNPDRSKIFNQLLNGSAIDDIQNIEDIVTENRCFENNNRLAMQFYNFISQVRHAMNANSLDEVCLWGNGIGFDNVILKELCLKEIQDYPINFRKDRDVRTILDMTVEKCLSKGGEERPTYEYIENAIKENINSLVEKEFFADIGSLEKYKHNAIIDCIYEAKLISYCHNILMK